MASTNQKLPQLPSHDRSRADELRLDIELEHDSVSNTTWWCRCPAAACVLIITLHPSLRERPPTDLDFKGHSHQTRSRRLFNALKIAGIRAVWSIVGLGICFAVQIKRGGSIPPRTWVRTVDQQTREEVEAVLTAGFETARRSAPEQQNDALREATFRVPHELARLNKDAPDFRLEDLGPMVHAKKGWEKRGETLPSLVPFIDCEAETRVFLYFPNGAAKATAVFLAVNHELDNPSRRPQRSAEGNTGAAEPRGVQGPFERSFPVIVVAFQQELLARSRLGMTGRIEKTERLPVIFNFREKAHGATYYTRFGYIDRSMCLSPLALTRLDQGILQQ